jgi:hypothetical protein
MNFIINNDFPGEQFLNNYNMNYKSINNCDTPVMISSNFDVSNYNSNCFFCTSSSGKIYILLPNINKYQGRFLYFVNVTNNELISVSNLTSLTQINNISNYNVLSSSILNTPKTFSILFSDGNYWYRIN